MSRRSFARHRPPARVDGHRPVKRFGQNFLVDQAVIAHIVRAIRPGPGQRMVEIGPGLGALTGALLPRLDRLDVIELDRDLLPRLATRFGDAPGLRIHHADALSFDYSALAGDDDDGGNGPTLRIVGNLPYNISTPLLFHLMTHREHILDMHFMLQKEVVDRLCAAPGSRDYGRLTVAVAARAQCEALFDVAPASFDPPPKVTSAIVRITPRQPARPIRDPAIFDRVVTAAFSQRRKTLANALSATLAGHGGSALISGVGIDPRARAETLTLDDFTRLAEALATDLPSGTDGAYGRSHDDSGAQDGP